MADDARDDTLHTAAPTRRVVLVSNGNSYVGPELCRMLAEAGHDLVVGDASPETLAMCEAAGATVVTMDRAWDLAGEGVAEALVAVGIERFGRIDAAVMFTGDIVGGRFLASTIDDLRRVTRGNIEAPYRALQAILPPMLEQGDGQVLVITSASGARDTPGAPLYSATRAAANRLVENVGMEFAASGVQVNAVGTNFMDFDGFLLGNGIRTTIDGPDDPERRARVEAKVPMKRLGTMTEFARFCMVFVDGTSRFQTGQFVSYSGGWSR